MHYSSGEEAELIAIGNNRNLSVFQRVNELSRVMRKPTFWFPTWSDTNPAVQLQKMVRCLKVRIQKVEGSYYLCCENKDADQLRGSASLFSHMQNAGFSHDAAQFRLLPAVRYKIFGNFSKVICNIVHYD